MTMRIINDIILLVFLLNLLKFMSSKTKILLVLIVFLAIFFRFWSLGQNDFLGDDGHYAFRALGWFDFLGSQRQTTPIQWFGEIPWWGNLSFHDHPPMNFLMQNITFRIFGVSAFAARIPAACLSLLAILFTYLIIKKYRDEKTAILAAFLLSISSWSIWISQQSVNDGLVVGFEMMALWFFINYVSENKAKNLIMWGMTVGLCLLSKYTAAFLLPAGILYLIIYRRDVFKKKEFWASIVGLLIVVLPIVIYNLMVFKTRGHFDAVLSHMVGMKPTDFDIIKNRVVNFNLFSNLLAEFKAIFSSAFFAFAVLKISGLIYLIFRLVKRKSDIIENVLIINIGVMLVMFLFMGPTERYLSIIDPLLLICTALLIFDVYNYFKKNNLLVYQIAFGVLIGLIFILEIFYAINTNILVKPIGQVKIFYSQTRLYNYGFNQLDEFIKKEIYPVLPVVKKNQKLIDYSLSKSDFSNQEVVAYDDTITWFATIGYFNKYIAYYNLPIMDMYSIKSAWPQSENILKDLNATGAKGLWFIYAVGNGTKDTNSDKNIEYEMKQIASSFEENGLKPIEIKNAAGQVAFKIYHLNFKDFDF